jgi:TonB family protein
LKIEGDVVLKVRFTAAGQVQILGVISGLGHGLDQQAEIAAQHIRFKPATRDGHPVNEVSIIHVTFQMA